MEYTVQQLAKLSHVSVRTLHHYDAIDLLKPSHIKPNGYRVYGEKELIRLQQILFFRELDFSLIEIKEMLASPHFNTLEALHEQQKMLQLKRDRLDTLLTTITNTITTMKKKKPIKPQEMYGSFNTDEMEQYQKEAKERWGHTDAWKQSQERTKNWTKADYDRVAAENNAIMLEIVKHMEKGPESDEIQRQIVKCHKGIEYFYDCSYDMFRCLGNMYSQDPRFAATYEKIHPGLAAFMTKAINYYCDSAKQ